MLKKYTLKDGLFVAIFTNGELEISPDGILWQIQNIQGVNAWLDIEYDPVDDLLKAVVSTDIGNKKMISSDGKNWEDEK